MADDSTLTNDPAAAAAPAGLRPIADERFEIHEELARGGLGKILRARDPILGRLVAIKVPLKCEESSRRRFVREALLTARLQHPSIVPVYEAGLRSDGEPFYAMKLVEGRSLKELLTGAQTPAARLALLPNLIAVADAVGYAHQRRIIHRDLKPSNVLVGSFGETVVLDWGLAKELALDEDDSALSSSSHVSPGVETHASAVMGTPRYMAPEQEARGAVDERADVYALGAMLCHLLTGAPPPLTGATQGPAELVAIMHKAMARRPEDRYPTARELGDDLRRFATGQLVSSHEYSAWALLARFVRRHRVAVTVAAVLTTVLAVVLAVSAERVARARSEAERRRDELILEQARTALARDPTAALAWLKQYPAGAGDWRGARTLISAAQAGGIARFIVRKVTDGGISADGNEIAGITIGGAIVRWNIVTGEQRVVMNGGTADASAGFLPNGDLVVLPVSRGVWRCPPRGECRSIWRHTNERPDGATFALSPDGKWLATSDTDNDVRLIDLESGRLRDLPGHTGELHETAFSADSRWLASGGVDRSVRVWNVATGESRVLLGHSGTVRGVRFSRDAKWLVSGSHDGTVRLWDLTTGQARVLSGHDGPVFGVDFSPDGKLVASCGGDHTVRVWPVGGGEPRILRGHTETVLRLQFSPDGRTLASGGEDQTVRLWNLDDGDARVLRGHQSPILRLTFSADGKRLFTRAFDSELRVWDVTPPAGRIVATAGGDILRLAFAGDGRLAFSAWDGTVVLCDGTCRVLGHHSGAALNVVFAPDGTQLASTGFDGVVRLWKDGGVTELKGHVGPARQVAFTPDGRTLASVGDDHTVRLWDLASGRDRVIMRLDDAASVLAMSPDGRQVAAGGFDHTVRVYDRTTGAVQVLRGHTHWVSALVFSPDSMTLASAGFDGAVRLWDAAGSSRLFAGHEQAVPCLAFSPDGTLLASASLDKTARVWNVASGAVRVLGEHGALVKRVAFSRDGKLLATGGDDRLVRLWDLASGEALVLGAHQAILRDLAFSPDGTHLLSSGNDHVIRSWSLADSAPLPVDGAADRALLARLTSAAILPSGTLTSQ